MTGSLRLVVARYQESLDWVQRVDKKWHRSIVTKGVQVPNTGREASSYLWAMEEFYEDDGWICFVQGAPFHHYPALYTILNKTPQYPLQYVPLGKGFVKSDEDGGPHDQGLPVKEWWEAMIGEWPGAATFAPGAQFIVPAAYIRARTLDEIRALRELCDTTEYGAHTMERLWQPWIVW